MRKIIVSALIVVLIISCVSTKSTIKNINDTISKPALNEALNSFVITTIAKDKKYGLDPDYPINVGFTILEEGLINQTRYLNALAGPNGEKIRYEIKKPCCPYPTKKSEIGVGLIDTYEITWDGLKKPIILYLNKYDKGELMIPLGFSIRK
jgi:hypothetical protein